MSDYPARIEYLEAIVAKIVNEFGVLITPASAYRAPTIKQCIIATALHFEVPVSDILSPVRSIRVVNPRHIAMYVAKTITTHTLPAIGRVFGRDHTTVLAGVRRIRKMRETDESLRRDIWEISSKLLSSVKRDALLGPAAGLLTDHSAVGLPKNDAPTIPPGASSGAVVEALPPQATAPTP